MILVSISMFAGPRISNIVSLSTWHVLVLFFLPNYYFRLKIVVFISINV